MHFHDIMGKKVEVKKAEPRDSNAPGQLGPNQWGPRGILSAANGWSAQPAQGWQQSYGPPGVWVSTGQPLGGYGPPLSAGRGAPTQPPSPFNAFLVTAAPAGGFGAPQAYAQQGYSTPPQFGYSFGTPHGDQYAPQGVPPPPTTPGTGPLGFAPATTPTQDMSKAPTGQPDFPYSQYGLGNYPQEPSSYGPTRPSHSNGQDVQGENSAVPCFSDYSGLQGDGAIQCLGEKTLWSGPEWVWAYFRRPQPADCLLRGTNSTTGSGTPGYRSRFCSSTESQRNGLPSIPALSVFNRHSAQF